MTSELEAERDRFAEYLQRWQQLARELFGTEDAWPDDGKSRNKIREGFVILRELEHYFVAKGDKITVYEEAVLERIQDVLKKVGT